MQCSTYVGCLLYVATWGQHHSMLASGWELTLLFPFSTFSSRHFHSWVTSWMHDIFSYNCTPVRFYCSEGQSSPYCTCCFGLHFLRHWGKHQGFFYGDCVSFWALHLQNKCLLNSCICSVKINNSVTLLSACRLSCHKKCEVKVRDGSSFTPYHKWIITCLHDLCTIQYVYMATRAQHSSAFMQIHTVFTYCEDT